MKIRVEKQIGASVLSIETGLLAKQAAGSCLVQYGETVVLAAVADGPPRPGVSDFFPLTCDYRERTAAAGKFPGGFLKREGRPTMKETLTARLMDRPIRPLFPSWFHDEVQIQSFVMASDRQNDADVLAMIGASSALGLSPLPFEGPLGSVRLGHINGVFVPFPTQDDLEESDLDLVVSGSKDAILMIEGFAREMPEDRMLEALAEAHRIVKIICDLQLELFAKANVEKRTYEAPTDDGLYDKLKDRYFSVLRAAKQTRRQACACRSGVGAQRARLRRDDSRSIGRRGDLSERAVARLARSGRKGDSRSDPRRHARRWPRFEDGSPHRVLRRRSAARPRLGGFPARRNTGADHRYLGYRPRRTARRWTDRRVFEEVHARLTTSAVFGR